MATMPYRPPHHYPGHVWRLVCWHLEFGTQYVGTRDECLAFADEHGLHFDGPVSRHDRRAVRLEYVGTEAALREAAR